MSRKATPDAIKADLKRVAGLLSSDYVTARDYDKHGKFDHTTVLRHFGSWKKAIYASGMRARGPLKKQDVIAEIQRVAKQLNKQTISLDEFNRHATFSQGPVYSLFGSWIEALRQAGLRPAAPSWMTRSRVKAPEILDEIRRIARALGISTISYNQFRRHSCFGLKPIQREFGTWKKAVEAAGLSVPESRIPDAQLEAEFRRVHTKLGRVPTTYEFDVESQIDTTTYQRRFGSWNAAVSHYLGAEHARPTSRPLGKLRRPKTAGRTKFGGPLNFRGLQHEPVTEQGVVLLFGMVAQQLGFLVEAVGAGFPDCRAKRILKPGLYTEVRIEFEYKSSRFKLHRHKPSGCDLIVCWEDDWPDCPVEVLELKSAIRGLDPNG
jgi:hypothetical protein